MNILTK